jgi:hypothetical protein
MAEYRSSADDVRLTLSWKSMYGSIVCPDFSAAGIVSRMSEFSLFDSLLVELSSVIFRLARS